MMSREPSQHRMPAPARGFLYLQFGRPDLAEPAFVEAVPMRGDEPVFDTPGVGHSLTCLGLIRETRGRMEDALQMHTWALRAFAAAEGERAQTTVMSRANLARTYAALRRPADADPCWSRSFSSWKRKGKGAVWPSP